MQQKIFRNFIVNFKTFLIITIITFTANSNAGWMDKLSDSSNKIQEKLQNIKKTDTNSIKNSLSTKDIITGLKQALNKGAGYAVNSLGKTDGFMKNTDVKIPMPKKLGKAESLLRKAGKEKYATEFVTTMNRAAESAVPLTLNIIKQGIRNMSITDAKNILQGPDDAATQYLKKTGSNDLRKKILPIVKKATAKTGVTAKYKKMLGKLGFAGKYLNLNDYDIDTYVTQKTMAGLFTMIAREEKKIRDNPVARTTDILKKVFGSI